jgi:cyclopropane fatty-acyl-phospholipid synthase-like methyltransferase
MHIPGSRTFQKYALKTKTAFYDILNMEQVPEERHRIALVKAMGFEGQWNNHRAFQMEFLRHNGLTGQTRFMEIGSGPLTLAIPLMRELDPGNYTGVDVRESVTNLAYLEISRAGVAGRNPRLIVSDDFGTAALGTETFDMVWSFSVLYHLNDDLVETWFENVKQRLAPHGRYWANINDRGSESQWLEFPFVNRSEDFYAAIAHKNGLALQSLGTIESLGFKGQGPEKMNIMLEVRHA